MISLSTVNHRGEGELIIDMNETKAKAPVSIFIFALIVLLTDQSLGNSKKMHHAIQ